MDESRDSGDAAPEVRTQLGVARGDRVHEFTSDAIRVTWSRMRCTHAAECVMHLPTVFEPGRRPWVDLSQGSPDAVARTVQRCPTGALHFERSDGGEPEPVPAENTLEASRNGPLLLRGDIEVQDERGGTLLCDTRVALCRCGHSAHRPLCDNTHQARGFRDDGAVREPERAEEAPAVPPRLTVRPHPDGPLEVTGPFTLASGDRTTKVTGSRAKFCRCGQSSARPFCDGTHKRIGFRSE